MRRGPLRAHPREGRRAGKSLKPGLLLPAALAAAALAGQALAGPGKPDADQASRARDLARGAVRDLACVRGWAEGLSGLLDHAASRPGLFAARPERWTLEEEKELRGLWRGILDHVWALEGMKRLTEEDAGAFPLYHAASVAQYEGALRWVGLAQGVDRVERILDEADAEQGIPGRSFAGLKFRNLHVWTIARFTRHDRRFRRLADGLPDEWLRTWPAAAGDRVRAILKQRGLQDIVENGADIAGDATFAAWFPAQKGIAEWMGDTKVRRRHRTLIVPEQASAMAARMLPGDVIVERRNWYLSNVGLPGFWPHAVLYVGTLRELDGFFDGDAETDAWLKALPGAPGTLAEALARAHPEAWSAYVRPGEAHGSSFPNRVLEAVSEGVVFHPAEESLCGDYAAALRPRLRRVDKAKALLEAFRRHGRPYDFNFDFATDGALVCSELVWKSYLPDRGKAGLNIPLARVCGRDTLPPNDLVRLFDQEAGKDARQFDFVFFLDGVERGKLAVERAEKEFRASWRRPKWDIAQK